MIFRTYHQWNNIPGKGHIRSTQINPKNNSRFWFLPSNHLFINSDKTYSDYLKLRGLTINGQLHRGDGLHSTYVYTHDLVNKYECVPFMKIDLATAIPTNARHFDDIIVDKTRVKEVRSEIKRVKRIVSTVMRLDENGTIERIKKARITRSFNSIYDAHDAHDANALRLSQIIGSTIGNEWLDDMLYIMAHFPPPHNNDVFDRVIRFHQAAIFRHLGAVK